MVGVYMIKSICNYTKRWKIYASDIIYDWGLGVQKEDNPHLNQWSRLS